MKASKYFIPIFLSLELLICCDPEKCECNCEGDFTIYNNTGTDVIIFVTEPSTSKQIMWDWLVESQRITYEDIPEGEYSFIWETESAGSKSKLIKISDCEETTETINN